MENEPTTTSSTKSVAAIGVLYAPATPAAMPQAVRMRTRSGETFHRRASADANAAPIWMIGPSRPSEPPVAMTAIDEAPRASDGRSRTVRRPSETTSIMCEMPLGPFSPKKKNAISPPTSPPAAGSRTRTSGSRLARRRGCPGSP